MKKEDIRLAICNSCKYEVMQGAVEQHSLQTFSPCHVPTLKDTDRTRTVKKDAATRHSNTLEQYVLYDVEFVEHLVHMGQNMSFPHFFSTYQWGLIENAVTLLGLLEELTRKISSHTATASDVIPSVEALKRLLNKSLSTDSRVKTRKATLLEAVKHWFNCIYTEPLYFLATILDPKYKDRFFDQATKQRVTEMLLSQLNKMTAPENSTEKERKESEPPLKKDIHRERRRRNIPA